MIHHSLDQLGARIDALSLRERALLFAAVLVVLFMLWNQLFFAPLEQRRAQLSKRLEATSTQLAQINRQVSTLAAQGQQDPNRALQARLQRLREEHAGLDERLESVTLGLVPPRDMARVLEEVLERQQALTLVHLENLGAEPLFEPAREVDNTEKAAHGLPRLYRHGLRIEFQGTYQGTLDYLQALEALPHNLFWGGLELRVTEYPMARVGLTVYTLSLREGWIGV